MYLFYLGKGLDIISMIAIVVGIYYAFLNKFYSDDKTYKEKVYSGLVFSVMFTVASICQ